MQLSNYPPGVTGREPQITGEQTHEPGHWVLVVQSDNTLVMSAMCICGDDDCHWTASAYKSSWVHIQPQNESE